MEVNWNLTELRKSDGVRWAVGDPHGRRSSTYRFWGNKKGDFYLAARSLGGTLKTSLHRDGRCHTGLTSDYAAKLALAERHMDRWTIPLDQMVKAVQVVVAEDDLVAYSGHDTGPMRWLRAPQPGHIALVGVLIVPTKEVQRFRNSWPGADLGTEPVGIIATSTRTAFAVHWENPLLPGQAHELNQLRERVAADARQRGIAPAPNIRAVLIGQIGDDDAATRSLMDVSLASSA